MIKSAFNYSPTMAGVSIAVCLSVFVSVSALLISQVQAVQNADKKLVTIHDRGKEKVIITKAGSVKAALKEADIPLDANDAVEPRLDTELIEKDYSVNIYRARPVIVADGAVRQKIMTPYQTADRIAASAGITLNDADKVTLAPTRDIVSEGAGVELKIDRATPFTFVLYGKKTDAFTQARTVRAMLAEKNVALGADDHVSVPLDAPIATGMIVSLTRDGMQTVTEEQDIPFAIEKVYDTARPVGYREIQTAGTLGKRTITYQVEMRQGREVTRTEIQSVILSEPKKQIEIVGLNPGNGLSRSKGAHMFTDSKGVVHRETYYDLPMNVVMQSCGGGGYTVRPDGAKIDKDGYILVAAHLGNYPRCSIVETSLGLGKVYDTGGFVARHPHGFDLATDWTNNDGR